MSHCRICRTENNLKYSLKELRRINKKLGNSTIKHLLHAGPAAQTGNICYDCEDRLHNFNKLIEEDEDVDVDCSGDVREESPVIVDDDELLYNMFFNKNKNKLPSQTEQQQPQVAVTQQEFAHSLGSDGDTEIIEVLTSSRESTPANDEVNSSVNHFLPNSTVILANKPVAIEIIDLEQDEKKTEKSDDEEIIFRRVEPQSGVNKPNCVDKKPKNKRIRKRRYSDSEIKLIASLSLLSSDSETELQVEPIPKLSPIKSCADKPTTNTTLATAVQLVACNSCKLNFSDVIALQSHQLTHTCVNCPVCNAGFPVSQRLVHHMRSKHRSYAGSMLSERSKCPQDSAMTIRLRYMQRYTYYECQLCGQIDAVFKTHKSHVITKHEDESKSLKDPMMKELECHICRKKCGTQYLTLCCHLRQQHPDKHEPQLREVTHSHPFGWNAARQRDVESSAKVFQFSTRKSRYFECRICKKVTAGYFKHWKHLNVHSNGSHEKLLKRLEEINQLEAKKTRTEANKNESLPAKKTEKTAKNQLKKKVIKVKQNESKRLKATLPPNEIKNKKPKKLRKINKNALIASIVKVKPVLQRFPTQKYKCKFCKQKLKGFYCLNRHQIEKHLKDEYHFCIECKKAFSQVEQLKSHTKDHHKSDQKIINLDEDLPHHRHHKRKCRGISFYSRDKNYSNQINLVDENCNTDSTCVNTPLIVENDNGFGAQKNAATKDSGTNSIWLKDLMRFAIKQSTKTNGAEQIHQCQYCTRLFNEHRVMQLHEQGHATRQDVPMIKRIALTVPKES